MFNSSATGLRKKRFDRSLSVSSAFDIYSGILPSSTDRELELTLYSCSIFLPNRTFLVRLGGTSGEFGRAKIQTMARPNEPDILGKRTKKVRLVLGIYRTQTQTSSHDIIHRHIRSVTWYCRLLGQ